MKLFLLDILAQIPDQPTGEAPPGLDEFGPRVLNWLFYIAGIAAVGGLIWIGIMMMVGRRNRSQMAADGLSGLPWVVGGLIIVSSAAKIASEILA